MVTKKPKLVIHVFKTNCYREVREIETFIRSITSVGPTSEKILELKELRSQSMDKTLVSIQVVL